MRKAKVFFIRKGKYEGDCEGREPFYSTVLTKKELNKFNKKNLTKVILYSKYEELLEKYKSCHQKS